MQLGRRVHWSDPSLVPGTAPFPQLVRSVDKLRKKSRRPTTCAYAPYAFPQTFHGADTCRKSNLKTVPGCFRSWKFSWTNFRFCTGGGILYAYRGGTTICISTGFPRVDGFWKHDPDTRLTQDCVKVGGGPNVFLLGWQMEPNVLPCGTSQTQRH